MDIQVQAHSQEQSEPIATQTESTAKCDFQVQENIPLERNSIAVQTMKEEIRMPNIPNSVAQTPAKKRKLSSNVTPGQLGSASVEVFQPAEPIQNGPGDQSSNEQANLGSNADDSSATQESQPSQSTLNEAGDQSNTKRADKSAKVDDSILNTEVYQIYSRENDPEEAMKKIKELKNCIEFCRAWKSFPTVKEFERLCKSTLGKLWKQKTQSGTSKFDKVKHFMNARGSEYEVFGSNYDPKSMGRILDRHLTKIQMLTQKGYEYWYVANFDKGHGSSKWYRAVSSGESFARRLAQLNVIGITNSTLDQLRYNHYSTMNSTETKWLDFSDKVIERRKSKMVRWVGHCYKTGMLNLKCVYKYFISHEFRFPTSFLTKIIDLI